MKQKKSILAFGTALLGITAIPWTARAQDEQYAQSQYVHEAPSNTLPAPSRAFELQLSTGYTQGIGNVFPQTSISRVAGAGIGFTGDLAYRVNPRVSLDLEGQYSQFVAENSTSSNGFNANIGLTMHGGPSSRVDPWLRLGTGWRWVWQHNPTNQFGSTTIQTSNDFSGWQLVTARLGLDLRSSAGVAWAPFVGADLQSFFWVNGRSIPSSQWGTFLYAGLQGRFDFGPRPTYAAANALTVE